MTTNALTVERDDYIALPNAIPGRVVIERGLIEISGWTVNNADMAYLRRYALRWALDLLAAAQEETDAPLKEEA